MSAQNYTYNGTIGDWMEEGDGGTPAVPQQHDPSSFPGATGTQQQQQQQQQKNSGVKKKRVRNWSADDRAAHRAFERSRREAFKERLVNLSKLTPSLKDVDPSKLSKHVVLDESIALHKSQQQKLSASMRQVDSLLAERDEILAELNQWRSSFGLNPRQPTALPPMPEEKEPKTRTFSAGSGSAPQFDTRASMSAPAGGGASSLPGPGMAEWEESPTSLDGQYYSGGEPPSASFPILDNTIEGGLPIAAASASVSKQPAPDPSWDALTLPIASSDGGGMNPMAHPPPAHLSSTPNPFIHGNLGDLHPRDYGMGGMPFDAGHMQMPMVNHLGVLEGIHEQRGV